MRLKLLIACYLIFFSMGLIANSPLDDVPVLYKGRFRPMEAYAKLWLYEVYHRPEILPEHRDLFYSQNGSALEFLWNLAQIGHEKWDDSPLFWIKSAEAKSLLGLNPLQKRFSYNELKKSLATITTSASKTASEELQRLQNAVQLYVQLPSFLALPKKTKPEDWQSLSLLETQERNFTSYSQDEFNKIREAYINGQIPALATVLKAGYESLAGKKYQEAWGKHLSFPTPLQIKAEVIYFRYPIAELCLIGYSIALITLLLGWNRTGIVFVILSFLLHSALLGIRIFILQRPPVSNMFETVIYVPWICVLASLFFTILFKDRIALIASCGASVLLLAVLKLADLNPSLENVQAVLDSQYWLIIHVLMIVGSYGVFILCAALGHIYLAGYMLKKMESPYLASTAKCILHSMYLGTALLIPGTILGGVWAAESWGRFWDWDPKESWAFISACIYLLFIHAYRFHHIHNFGLAIGSIAGVMAISFTWYGVNYILGTGLHSYGFGNGGEVYYYLYLLAEGCFLAAAFFFSLLPKTEAKSN